QTAYRKEAIVKAGERYYRAYVGGTSGDVMPTSEAETFADGGVTWHFIGTRLDVIDYVAHRIWREGGIYMRGDDGKAALVPAPDYRANTAYKVGDQVTNNNNTYRAKAVRTDGRSGAASAPTTTADTIDDGNVTWSYLGPKRRWVAGRIANWYRTAYQRIKTIVESSDRTAYVIQFSGSKPENDDDPPVVKVIPK